MEKRNELNRIHITNGLTYINMVGDDMEDPIMGELALDLKNGNEENFQDVVDAISVLRDVWDRYYNIAKEIRQREKEEQSHGSND